MTRYHSPASLRIRLRRSRTVTGGGTPSNWNKRSPHDCGNAGCGVCRDAVSKVRQDRHQTRMALRGGLAV